MDTLFGRWWREISKAQPGFPAGLLFLLLVLLPSAPRAEEPEKTSAAETPANADEEAAIAPLAAELLKQIENEKPENIWEPAGRLVRLGRTHGALVAAQLEKALSSENENLQLASARALCQLNSTARAADVLLKLARQGTTAEIRRLAANAIGLATSLYGDEKTAEALCGALKQEPDEAARISLARSLWRISSRDDGQHELLRILEHSASKAGSDEAALVLAENGSRQAEVRRRLLNLFTEPTAQGERAFNLLRRFDFEEDAGRARESKPAEEAGGAWEQQLTRGELLLREILYKIKYCYPDETKVKLEKLFENAAQGMVNSLDQFSQYMNREETKATQELLQQDYCGIGAYVGLHNSQFIITCPIYGSPADKAGLHALDAILEVDGKKTSELLESGGLSGVVARLKGEPGTVVKLKYYRRGFAKPLEVLITRDRIRVETVFSALLPGNVGYIRLTRFGERSTAEMQAALEKLFKQQQAQALVLDLRNNPGGLLRAGVDIANQFLPEKKLIVYSEGNENFPRKEYFSTGAPGNESFPMVVLVGAGSASASEIVAGALQDLKRAPLIGEKTFGKGSVQQIIPLRATANQTQLKLTVAKYYLPSGRCIHEKGVDVDIEIKPPETHSWVVEKLMDLRQQAVFEDYFAKRWPEHKDLFLKLADGDAGLCANWPDFDSFYQSLHTQVEPEAVRAELRGVARRLAQDEQKREFVVDLQEDEVLQRGVLEVLKRLNTDPLTIAEYKTLPEKFKNGTAAVWAESILHP